VLLLAETGARRDEVVTLLWADLDLKLGWLTIHASRSKTGKTRRIPLPRAVVAELRQWRLRTPGARVIPVGDASARPALYRKLKATCERLGLTMISPQSLRRYRERELSRAGVGVEVFARLLGHSPTVALTHYLRATDDDLRAAVDLVSGTAHT
jgi:integrase